MSEFRKYVEKILNSEELKDIIKEAEIEAKDFMSFMRKHGGIDEHFDQRMNELKELHGEEKFKLLFRFLEQNAEGIPDALARCSSGLYLLPESLQEFGFDILLVNLKATIAALKTRGDFSEDEKETDSEEFEGRPLTKKAHNEQKK